MQRSRLDGFGLGRFKLWQTCLIAVVATGATLGLRLALEGPLGGQPTLVIFTLPIMLSAYAGGLWAGLLATLLSLLAASYFLLPPIHSFAVGSAFERWHLFFVALAGVFISAVSEALHRARRRAVLMEGNRAEIESHLVAIVESSDDAIIGKNLEGIVTSWNRGAEIIFGYTAREMVGVSITRLIPAERLAEEDEILAKINCGESVEHFETVRQRKDGKRIDVSMTISPIRDAAGGVIGASKVARDITERKRTEEALRESEEKFSKAFQSNPAMVFLTTLEGTIVDLNRAYQDFVGLPREEILGKSTVELQLVSREERERLVELLREAGGKLYNREVSVRLRDGRTRDALCSVEHFSLGGVPHRLTTLFDITEQKRTETLLRDSEEKFRAIADQSLQGIVLFQEGIATYVNPALCEITGYSREEELAQTIEERFARIHPDNSARVLDRKRRFERGESFEEPEEILITRKDGELRWVLSSNRAFTLQGRPARLGIVLDITERKRAEAARRESEARYRTLFERAPDGILIADPEGRYVDANAAACQMLGYAREEMIGMHSSAIVLPEDIPHIQEALDAIHAGSDYHREWNLRRKDGSIIPTEVVGTLMPDGNAIGLIRDTTRRKETEESLRRSRAELRSLATNLRTAREEEAIRISREIHDQLGQELTGLQMDVSALRRSLEPVVQSGERKSAGAKLDAMSKAIDGAIETARRIAAELRPAMLDELGLTAALEWQTRDFEERSSIFCNLALPPVEPSLAPEQSTALFRIFQEALTNIARHAQATEVSVELRTGPEGSTLEVRDNGVGIESFERARHSGHGFIGMRERALAAGLHLDVESSPGKGTKIVIEAPKPASR